MTRSSDEMSLPFFGDSDTSPSGRLDAWLREFTQDQSLQLQNTVREEEEQRRHLRSRCGVRFSASRS